MLNNNEYLIDKQARPNEAEDYKLLRSVALEHIQKLSGNVWTDHNTHDPGITILEQLCYALTDLGYRTSFDINDILTPFGETGPKMENAFHSAKQILTSHPVTVNDYRKLLIDMVPGVRNAWLEIKDDEDYSPGIYFDKKLRSNKLKKITDPYEVIKLKGLYRVKIELEDYEVIVEHHKKFLEFLTGFLTTANNTSNYIPSETEYKDCYTNYIRTVLMQHRNLCEDFVEIQILEDEIVSICADIEITGYANADEVLKTIYKEIYQYITPSVKLYTLEQLLEKGKSIEQIFQGSIAQRGFIDYDELEKFDHRKVIYTSDIISLIMDIEGVQSVRGIHLNSFNNDAKFSEIKKAEKYCLKLSNPQLRSFKLRLDMNDAPKDRLNKLVFHKGLIFFYPQFLRKRSVGDVIGYTAAPKNFVNDLEAPKGENRQLDDYVSIQDEFPQVYKVGKEGISEQETPLRKAQRMQLKAYLMFFDQLLADYLAQLNHVKDLLSWDTISSAPTYYTKELSNSEISDLNKIIDDYRYYPFVVEQFKTKKKRHIRFLDHLLARFNEKFVDYSMIKFKQNKSGILYKSFTYNEVIRDETDFLRHYPQISGGRSKAFDYTQPLSSKNYTVLELRISKILGIDSDKMNRPLAVPCKDNDGKIVMDGDKMKFPDNRLAKFDEAFGIHIFEHILFRPQEEDLEGETQTLLKLYIGNEWQPQDTVVEDPFSFKVTVAVPGWLAISNRLEFRRFIEQQIRMEMPAHVGVKICWIDPRQMFELETAYTDYLSKLAKYKDFALTDQNRPAIIKDYKAALEKFATLLSTLNNMYPPAQLDIEYDFDFNELKPAPVILDHTALAGGSDLLYVFDEIKNEIHTPSTLNDGTVIKRKPGVKKPQKPVKGKGTKGKSTPK